MIEVMLSKALGEVILAAVRGTGKVTQTGSQASMEEEDARQEFAMKMTERQARAAQEIAIADRIRTAEEVEIEEIYDYSGEGAAGLRFGQEGGTLGLSGKGSRVTRRVYRFKGGGSGSPTELLVQGAGEDTVALSGE